MTENREDLERRRLRQRLVELRNQLHEVTGGDFTFGPAGEGLTLQMEVEFLERIIATELTPPSRWLDRLNESGYEMPGPDELSDAEIGLEVWQVIQRLAELRVYLTCTDHLSDRELYHALYNDILPRRTSAMPMGEDSACHIDLTGSGSDEDIACWLRFYADDALRRDWHDQFPETPLPPREEPPFDRDRLLPARDILEDDFAAFLNRLIDADWEDPQGPVQLSTDLAHDALVDAPFYVTARIVLETLRDDGPVKATAKLGNLPRAFIKQVYPRLPLSDLQREEDRLFNKVLDEEDVRLLHEVRLAAGYAGLLRKHKGSFAITKRGRSLLDPTRAGDLYRALFITFFRRINLAYFDGAAELPGIQATLGPILWRLPQVASDWTDSVTLKEKILLPQVLDEIDRDRPAYRTPGLELHVRLFQHLVNFALLEAALPDEPGPRVFLPEAYRITALYEHFISFEDAPFSPPPSSRPTSGR